MKRFFLSSNSVARFLLLPLLLCVVLFVGTTAARAQGEEDDSGVPEGTHIHDFENGVVSSAGLSDAFESQGYRTTPYSCDHSGIVSYDKGEEFKRYEKIKKIAKDGTITYVDGNYIKTERLVTINCDGQPIYQYWQCLSCPRTPPPSVLGLAAARLRSKLKELEQLKRTFWPKPKGQAPLPGVGFFYGIEPKQFNDFQTDWLLVCGLHDCVSVSLRARPHRIYFTPGDGTKRKTGCALHAVEVRNSKDADDKQKVKCRHVYQKAGLFSAKLEILYKLEWDFRGWTWDTPPPVRTGVMYGTVGRPFPLTVHQRQPVVIG